MPEFEKFISPTVDENYDNRKGYDQGFLGVKAPVPLMADESYLVRMENGAYEIPYTHFSIIMHKERKLAVLTASNVDYSPKAKKPEEGKDYGRKALGDFGEFDIEKWMTDPRIPLDQQLPDKFYTKDRKNFDKGHIVRRDDVVWGRTYKELKRANGDTYHTTNCSPQVDSFNRSNRKGDWGRFENEIGKQAKFEKLCIFSGPILDDENDKIFNGYIDNKELAPVQIPSRFWKMVVAEKNGELETFAFILEQDLSKSDVEFNVKPERMEKKVSMKTLQKELRDVDFQKVYFDSDQFDKLGGKLEFESTELDDANPNEEDVQVVKKESKSEVEFDEDMAMEEWNDENSTLALQHGLKTKNHKLVSQILSTLNDRLDLKSRIGSSAVKSVLGSLKNYARFEELKTISVKLEQIAIDDNETLKNLAQAKIELGEISSSIVLLSKIYERVEKTAKDFSLSADQKRRNNEMRSEVLGLLGRCYKQYYINANPLPDVPRTADFEKAIEYYLEGSMGKDADVDWHNINIIALKTKEAKVMKGNDYAVSDEVKAMAEGIVENTIEKIKNEENPVRTWHYSNLVEANLALGNTYDAIKHLKIYLSLIQEPFVIQSTLRQFKELYMLNEESAPGDQIIPMMEARFIELGGKGEATKLDLGQIKKYEKVYGQTSYKSIRWLLSALTISKSIVRLGPNKFEGTGTGFVFEGSWISEKYKNRRFIMTNAHVCSDDQDVQQQIPYPDPPEALVATFLGTGSADGAEEIPCKSVFWTSPPNDLDATLIEIDALPNGIEPLDISYRKPPVTENGDARLNILGHPKGLDMRISLQDNTFVGLDETYLWYKTPTDGGSSGSPVFDQQWKLVGLHHASASAKRANEGIRIDVILERLREELK